METKFMQVQEEFNIPWITELLHQVRSGGGLGFPGHLSHQLKGSTVQQYLEMVLFRPEILALEADMFQKEQCSVKEQRQQQFKLRVLPVEHHTEAGPLKIEVLGRGFLNCWSFSPQPPILFLQPPSKPCRLLSMSPFSGIFTLYHKGKFLPPWSFLIPCELQNLDASGGSCCLGILAPEVNGMR